MQNVRWVGIPTDRYEETVVFFRDVLGLRVGFDEPSRIERETSDVRAPDGILLELAGRLNQ